MDIEPPALERQFNRIDVRVVPSIHNRGRILYQRGPARIDLCRFSSRGSVRVATFEGQWPLMPALPRWNSGVTDSARPLSDHPPPNLEPAVK